MRTRSSRLAAVLVLAFVAPALGDIAPDPEFGQSLAPRERTSVAMTAEEVFIRLTPERAFVRAVFHLENAAAAASLEVGFPDVVYPSSFSSDRPPEGVRDEKLHDFKALVDGKIVDHRYRYLRANESPFAADGAASRPDRWLTAGWLVWDMKFTPGQKRDVEVSYWVPYRPLYRPDLLGATQFTYVLKTGAAWRGPIGKAVIEVTLADGLTRKHLGEITPAGFAETDGGIRFALENLEPEADVQIAVRRYADLSSAADGNLAAAAEQEKAGKPDAAAIALARAAECLEQAERFEECAGACRRIVALEKAARGGKPGMPYVKLFWKDRYVPWECRIVRCLERLGRVDEARAAAKEAVVAIRAVLAEPKNRHSVDEAALTARAEKLEAFAAGGDFTE